MTEYPQGIADDQSSHYKCLCDDTIPVPSSPNELVEMDMETIDPFSESLSIPDFIPSASHSLSDLTDSSQEKRRVSLTLPSSPRLVQAWNFRDYTGLTSHVTETSAPMPERKGKMRKIADDGDRHETTSSFIIPHKKPCKKWSEEETRMLVEGCNTWGFGNWKAILKDPKLKFGNCSPVDLKDRFRTCFPDAYKEHYPNTKIRLSSKVRSTLPDGRSIFENTRNKKPHIFPGEEARALKADYEKHGTVWATYTRAEGADTPSDELVVSDVDMEDRDAEDDNVTFFPALSFVEGGSNDLKEYGLELQGREYELELQGQEYELELQGRVLDMQGDDEGLVAVPRALHGMNTDTGGLGDSYLFRALWIVRYG
ncbi:hypothetical protein M405DRAFT_166596 [Rhizopogon salebrosus TDB-379]|nr:hypothetical protein M405DRAFT_166596 [Rhizopogon salebrosus TDB-379]